MDFLTKKLGRLGAWLALALVLIVLGIVLYAAVAHHFTHDLKTEVGLEKGQTQAAIQSGHAAVDTIGNRQQAEANGAATVEEAQHEIDNATDPGSVTAAGLNGLHNIRGKAGDHRRR